MKRQAVGCTVCKGKGYVYDERSFHERRDEDTSTDPKAKERAQYNRDAYYKPDGSIFCTCQKPAKHWKDPESDDE